MNRVGESGDGLAGGFLLAFLLSFGPAVSNSFARFAYALVLPAMREDLVLSWSAAGWLNTANAFGYLAGAILTRLLVNRLGNRPLFQVGMVVTALAILATGFSRQADLLTLARFLAGLGGAAVFICGGALSANILPRRPDLGTTMIAIYFAGGGLGLVIGGLLVPPLLEGGQIANWPLAWQGMGGLSLGMAAVAWWAAARVGEPALVGTGPSPAAAPGPSPAAAPGAAPGATPGASPKAPSPSPAPAAAAGAAGRASIRPFLPELIAYLMFGIGYIGYMTFVVAWMREAGTSTTLVIQVWVLLGIATLVAPLVWRRALETWPGGRPMALAMAVLAVGAWLPLAGTGPVTMFASAALFGLAMFTVPSTISSLIKRSLPKPRWGEVMAVFTVVFAAGQTIGPIAAGWLADRSGSLQPGLLASVGMLAVGVGFALAQRDTTPRTGSEAGREGAT